MLVSVVLCTYNPRKDYLALALRSIGAQTLPYADFEVVVVDNNSSPLLRAEDLSALVGRPVRVVVEKRQGLTFARVCGIQNASADLILFVDDDNQLDSSYLKNAVMISQARPELGTYGGVTQGQLESKISSQLVSFLPYLGVRDYGTERIEGKGDKWGEWEPIGAGLVVRKEIAVEYVKFVENVNAVGVLGRTGKALMSGEDSLITRLGARLGYNSAYEPSLKLNHYISASRLKRRYLARLMYGHGRSYVALNRVLGSQVPSAQKSTINFLIQMGKNFYYRTRTESWINAIGMLFWDFGYQREASRASGSVSSGTTDTA